MKLVSIITVFSLFLSFSLFAQEDAFQSYDKEGVKLSYPSNWAMTENVMGAKVVFQAPLEKEGVQIPAGVSLVIQEIPGGGGVPPLKDVAEVTKSQLKLMLEDFQEVSSQATTLDEKEAYELIYTGKQNNYDLQFLQIFMIEDSKAYILTYNTQKDDFENHLDTARKIINSLDF